MTDVSTYFVYVRSEEENKPEVRTECYYGGFEPPEPVWCADIITAVSPAKAKYLFLAGRPGLRFPVDYPDDWPLTRVRKLGVGELSENEAWGRIHEILDHGGRRCDCPEEEEV